MFCSVLFYLSPSLMSLFFSLPIISVMAHDYKHCLQILQISSTSLPLFPRVKLAYHNPKLTKSDYWRKQYTELIDQTLNRWLLHSILMSTSIDECINRWVLINRWALNIAQKSYIVFLVSSFLFFFQDHTLYLFSLSNLQWSPTYSWWSQLLSQWEIEITKDTRAGVKILRRVDWGLEIF